MNLQCTLSMYGYGTSEGVKKSWDTRGRGRNSIPTKSLRPGQTTMQAWTNSKGDWNKRRASYHQTIVDSYMHGKKLPVGRKPIIWILGGGTASGKTSASRKILGENPNVVRVDPDEVKLSIPEYLKLKETDPMNAAYRVHEESSYVTKLLMAEAGAKGLDIVYDSTTSGNVGPQTAKVFTDRGYDVRIMFVDVPLAMAQQRAETRATSSQDPINYGRYVPTSVITSSHIGAAENFMTLKDAPGLTSKHFYDTQDREPRLIYERQDNKEETIHDKARWEQYQQKAKGNALAASWAMARPRSRAIRISAGHRRPGKDDGRKIPWQARPYTQVDLNY